MEFAMTGPCCQLFATFTDYSNRNFSFLLVLVEHCLKIFTENIFSVFLRDRVEIFLHHKFGGAKE